MIDYNRNTLASALTAIDAEDRDIWLSAGAACYSVGERELWDEYSRRSEKFDEREQNRVWKSFGTGVKTGIGTIFYVARQNGWTGETNDTPLPLKQSIPPKPSRPIDWAKNRRNLITTWKTSHLANDRKSETLQQYLRYRGLDAIVDDNDIPRTLRLHPSLGYYHDGKFLASFPTLLALVQDANGKPVSIHRTYLQRDGNGKADVPGSAKKIMPATHEGALTGSAIRLYPAAKTLAVAEGVETALAIRIATGLPVWAARDCYCLKMLQVPDIVKEVVICADRDEHGKGQEAAKALAARLAQQRITAKIILPEREGHDWLDVLNQGMTA